jgi:hypothetical protein
MLSSRSPRCWRPRSNRSAIRACAAGRVVDLLRPEEIEVRHEELRVGAVEDDDLDLVVGLDLRREVPRPRSPPGATQ